MISSKKRNQQSNPLLHLVAGGCAGFVESSVCHPLDTIKTRMQLARNSHTELAPQLQRAQNKTPMAVLQNTGLREASSLSIEASGAGGAAASAAPSSMHKASKIQFSTTAAKGTISAPVGPLGTAHRIVTQEGFFALYKGLTAVYTGIIPKMAIRFLSFEWYKEQYARTGFLGTPAGASSPSSTTVFLAGLSAGLTEAVLIVTPAEVCKIRMQGQNYSAMDPTQLGKRKYTNVVQTALTIVQEEGVGALYSGLLPTMLRQGCNQAVNFTAYQYMKRKLLEQQGTSELQSWQSMLLGGFSGGMGPMVNNPLDVVKTRLQKQVIVPNQTPKYTGLLQACVVIAKEEGFLALWKGITPRLLRIVPGQAITFMTYEAVSSFLRKARLMT